MKPQFDLSLYLVTDSSLTRGRKLEDIVEEAARGGVTIVQLREKELPTGEFIATARRIKAILDRYDVPLIINDRVDVALAVDAAGVHIGQSDMSYSDTRRLLGADKIIGLSVETFDEVIVSNALDVDYIGISPIFQSTTKTDTLAPFGIEGCRKAVEATIHRTVAIGGINLSNLEACFSTGIEGVALVSAIISAETPKSIANNLRNKALHYKTAHTDKKK